MTTETLYTPRGAGHDAPDNEPRRYVQPMDELAGAFGEWLDLRNDRNENWYYEKALEMIPDLSGRESNEISAIIAAFSEHRNIYSAGIFLSAAYNLMDTDDIVFDMPGTDIQLLGYKLGSGKRLIIASDGGYRVGEKSEGTIVSYGRCDRFGENSRGLVINFGNASAFGWMSSSTIINFGETSSMGDGSSGLIINHGGAEKIGRNIGETDPVQITGRVIAATDPVEYFGALHIIVREAGCRGIPGLLEHIEGIRTGLGPHNPNGDVFRFLDDLDVEADVKRIFTEAGREL